MDIVFNEYKDFIKGVDAQVDALLKSHRGHMACGKGCDHCCMDFSVFPVEFHYIQEQMLKSEFVSPDQPVLTDVTSNRCALLMNGACSIYAFRPFICRTHGLPLVYLNEAGDEMELSFCERNFTDVDDDYFEIDNVMEQDGLNSDLFMINQRFLKARPELGLDEVTLMPLKELLTNKL